MMIFIFDFSANLFLFSCVPVIARHEAIQVSRVHPITFWIKSNKNLLSLPCFIFISVFDSFLEIRKTRFVPYSNSSEFLQKFHRQIYKIRIRKKQFETSDP